jgi:hypothetical protein
MGKERDGSGRGRDRKEMGTGEMGKKRDKDGIGKG